MKSLNLPVLATAVALISPVSEGCFSHIRDAQDEIRQQIKDAKEREGCQLRAELAEQEGNFLAAAEAYAYGGNKIKSQEMYLRYAQDMERKGFSGMAGSAYRKAGDEVKSKEMWLKHAKESEDRAYKDEQFFDKYYGERRIDINAFLCAAAKSYEEGGDKIKARELYLKYAQLAEKLGYSDVAAQTYEHIGDKTNARRLWLKFAHGQEQGHDKDSLCYAATVYDYIGYKYKATEIRARIGFPGCNEEIIDLHELLCD